MQIVVYPPKLLFTQNDTLKVTAWNYGNTLSAYFIVFGITSVFVFINGLFCWTLNAPTIICLHNVYESIFPFSLSGGVRLLRSIYNLACMLCAVGPPWWIADRDIWRPLPCASRDKVGAATFGSTFIFRFQGYSPLYITVNSVATFNLLVLYIL